MDFFGLPLETSILLAVCILAAAAFEFVNGFHDTANAVATVIYTNSLKPRVAVVWSGFMNFLGVYAGGIAVAMSISNLLPVSALMVAPLQENIAIILAVLLSAIVWNLWTWYLGLPCSSSHTLIGSLLGAGMVFAWYHNGESVNWGKAGDIGLSLIISPIVGFAFAIGLMYIMKRIFKKSPIFKEPNPNDKPPGWIRGTLIFTCTAVSFFHGSNDGQKGVGLIMLILISFLPLSFALNPEHFDKQAVQAQLAEIETLLVDEARDNALEANLLARVNVVHDLRGLVDTLNTGNPHHVAELRRRLQVNTKELSNLVAINGAIRNPENAQKLRQDIEALRMNTDYAPSWVLALVSISLGLGTMIGWKRIVVTIGEKIGKSHLTYAQGASAELIAAGTIGLSTGFGLPVSTTQVLSSGVAGTMVASKGVSNLQPDTIKNIAIAWLLTLPVTVVLAGLLFLLLRLIPWV